MGIMLEICTADPEARSVSGMDDRCLSWTILRILRTRLLAVLRPRLGEVAANERATVIAQALVDGCGDPETIVSCRLAGLPGDQRRRVSAEVAGVWFQVMQPWRATLPPM